MAFNQVSVINTDFYMRQWDIKSFTDPDKAYRVSLRRDGSYECSCPVWKYRRRECKHISTIKATTNSSENTAKSEEFEVEEVKFASRWAI